MNRKIFTVFIIVDLAIIIIYLIFSKYIWLLNTQIALVSSLLVTIGSYLGYKKNIQNRAKEYIDDNMDEIDKIDDKFDLYSDEIKQINIEEPTKQEILEAMKPIKQNYFSNFKLALSGMASFYRLFGYIFLIIGFFYLNNNNYLEIYPYIVGFIIVPLSSLISSIFIKNSIS